MARSNLRRGGCPCTEVGDASALRARNVDFAFIEAHPSHDFVYGEPTLEAHSQFVAPTDAVATRLLSRPSDAQVQNIALVTRPDLPLLQSLGGHFVIGGDMLSAAAKLSVALRASPLGGCARDACVRPCGPAEGHHSPIVASAPCFAGGASLRCTRARCSPGGGTRIPEGANGADPTSELACGLPLTGGNASLSVLSLQNLLGIR